MEDVIAIAPYLIIAGLISLLAYALYRYGHDLSHSIPDERVGGILRDVLEGIREITNDSADRFIDLAREGAESTDTPLDDFLVDYTERAIHILLGRGYTVIPPDGDEPEVHG